MANEPSTVSYDFDSEDRYHEANAAFEQTRDESLNPDPADGGACGKNLRALLQHQHLAPVRAPALNDLPAGERRAWVRFWIEVNGQLQRADAAAQDPSAAGKKP